MGVTSHSAWRPRQPDVACVAPNRALLVCGTVTRGGVLRLSAASLCPGLVCGALIRARKRSAVSRGIRDVVGLATRIHCLSLFDRRICVNTLNTFRFSNWKSKDVHIFCVSSLDTFRFANADTASILFAQPRPRRLPIFETRKIV